MPHSYDLVVIGGGFYGLKIALHAREVLGLKRIAVVEREPDVMNRASYVNQARVHNGYHYPRSILTAHRSRVNFPEFTGEFGDAVVSSFDHYYAVARQLSKINARQFETFCDRIGASWTRAKPEVTDLFSSRLIEGVYLVQEPAFDSRILRQLLLDRIEAAGGIELHLGTQVEKLAAIPGDRVAVETSQGALEADRVISAVYSQINVLHRASGIPTLGLQHEVADMALVTLPEHLQGYGFTVLDGAYFSMMPFPSRRMHSLSHVRYTPRYRWHDRGADTDLDPDDVLSKVGKDPLYVEMRSDVARYIPSASSMTLGGAITEVKTVLSRTEHDDSRPILYSPHHGIRNYTCIMGGKLDNIYDVLGELVGQHG